MDSQTLLPHPLKPGDTLGVFTPSSPSYTENPELFQNGVRNLEKLGFKVKLGSLTKDFRSQGYRSSTAQDRAAEFMELILNPEINGLISTIGGSNSSSMIKYLDFDAIKKSRKIICGYSDVTSLHLAILKYANLATVYGPAVMCWFGDWPDGCGQSAKWFMEAVSTHFGKPRHIELPKVWSNHLRKWADGSWKKIPREWKENSPGWTDLRTGHATAPILAVNLNTLLTAAGTGYWPDLKNKILLVEDMDAPMSKSERAFRHLEYLGVFDQISALIVSKPEFHDQQGAPFSYDDLIKGVVGNRPYPVVSQFDCGHTLPMLSVLQHSMVELTADSNGARFSFI